MPEESPAPAQTSDPERPAALARLRSRFDTWYRRNDIWFLIGMLAFAAVFVVLWSNIVISVRAGEAGVLWSRFFGTATDRVYVEGTHVILPWNKMQIYNVRYQKVDRTFDVLSNDGLDISVDVTIRFRPGEREVGLLHQRIGPDYMETVIIPESYAAVRSVVNQYRPEDLYAESFQLIQRAITERARREVRSRYVIVDDVQIRRITLPETIRDAIQRKLEQEQSYLEMTYRLQREEQEARRKLIEARGISDYQRTISATLTEPLLRFRGINATRELAQSANAKVVVIGGQDGLPLILNASTSMLPEALPAVQPAAQPVAQSVAQPLPETATRTGAKGVTQSATQP
ncbi:MAG: prohibitin family protein [Vicinamibacterales bacterium]|jgi:regulator of protease activity HflC (stomatin/prohibitin superfamily)|nr:prohibitin family protein [Vicinamibacterales bacterium]MDP7478439.1 prohibitin family protein [Vicinamibacterales bacterium]MDP7690388.1 prohibitin family protein [Vicinamibacterales bacterium]HJN44682.1 prohibitin family protein [Vicinamibacterales bacterium]